MAGRSVLVLLLAGSLAAFGGIYGWALLPIAGATLLLAILAPHHRDAHPANARALDWALVAIVCAIAVQLVPLPETWRRVLSPQAAILDATIRPDAVFRADGSGPLSANPAGTLAALVLVAATALAYRAARAIFSLGGVRMVCSAVGVIGAVAASEALIQRTLSPDLIYGFWRPLDPGARPFGPVVNRNHFAGWLVMASAVTAGYFIARFDSRRSPDRLRLKRATLTIAASGAFWTAVTWMVMVATIVVSQSRSAVVALALSVVTLARARGQGWMRIAGGAVVVGAIAALLVVFDSSIATRTASRFAETLSGNEVSRFVIWREALPMVQDFWLTGVGAGAFATAMRSYQRTHVFAEHLGSDRAFNHAHNHYLQLVAEGGLLVSIPVVIAAILLLRLAMRQWATEPGTLKGVRAGALAGLAAIAVQSIWEVPLTMPAAALLAATLAAMATYRRRDGIGTNHLPTPRASRRT